LARGLIRASFSSVKYDHNLAVGSTQRAPKSNKLALGYVHNLSKRPTLYATIARISNKTALV
jgi:hypothetical protein